MTKEKDPHSNSDNPHDMGHDYDGIREDNHPAPTWWWTFFIISIIFGFFYFLHYSLMDGETLKHRLARDMDQIESLRAKDAKAEPSEADLTALVASPAALKAGRETFAGKCVSCHGDLGQGGIGPNLTDNYWIHGAGTVTDIYHVVTQGVLEKGMPAWGAVLPPDEVKRVVAYVKSIHGSNPPNPKPPQGTEIHD